MRAAQVEEAARLVDWICLALDDSRCNAAIPHEAARLIVEGHVLESEVGIILEAIKRQKGQIRRPGGYFVKSMRTLYAKFAGG